MIPGSYCYFFQHFVFRTDPLSFQKLLKCCTPLFVLIGGIKFSNFECENIAFFMSRGATLHFSEWL